MLRGEGPWDPLLQRPQESLRGVGGCAGPGPQARAGRAQWRTLPRGCLGTFRVHTSPAEWASSCSVLETQFRGQQGRRQLREGRGHGGGGCEAGGPRPGQPLCECVSATRTGLVCPSPLTVLFCLFLLTSRSHISLDTPSVVSPRLCRLIVWGLLICAPGRQFCLSLHRPPEVCVYPSSTRVDSRGGIAGPAVRGVPPFQLQRLQAQPFPRSSAQFTDHALGSHGSGRRHEPEWWPGA